MSEHILITYATRRPYREVPAMPDRTHYDSTAGYWLKNGSPLIAVDDEFGPRTKKCDQETGEDQKDE